MTWVTKLTLPHDCEVPLGEAARDNLGTGSTWRCDQCNQLWEYVAKGVFWGHYFHRVGG
jgi:hypothetical protein